MFYIIPREITKKLYIPHYFLLLFPIFYCEILNSKGPSFKLSKSKCQSPRVNASLITASLLATTDNTNMDVSIAYLVHIIINR